MVRCAGLWLAFTWLQTSVVYGQYWETIRSGRPGQSIGPFVVGTKILQIQSGVDYFGLNDEAAGADWKGVAFDNVIRYGLSERWELSGLINFRSETISAASETQLSGLSAFDVGGRYHIYDGHGAIPSLGVQMRLRLPVLSSDYEIDKVAPRVILITGQQLSKTFSLATNWGVAWSGITNSAIGSYVINLGFPIAGKLGAFVENYGEITNGNFNTFFDGGLAFLVNNDLQLDLLGGVGDNDGISNYFISTGVSWRTKRK